MSHAKTNDLIHESSPYLLQHAHNPVHWMPWSERALLLAQQQDKPILVSIGYAACHWCHVMERESFEDHQVAALMNEHFINIKIDREERPDLDHIYMDAVQLMTGSGGWPLNVFLTPEGKPFFGGTYFPPRRMYQRLSWTEVIESVHNIWHERRKEVMEQADKLVNHMQTNPLLFGSSLSKERINPFAHEHMQKMMQQLMANADQQWGGIGKAPKFPQTFSLQYLLMYGHFMKDTATFKHALHSLESMIRGGIYDQLGGGFARYSTDDEWLVPHFEKMLYDNALLISLMSEAFMITGDPLLKQAIQQTISFCERELKSPNGGYFAALDADSEGEEGKFYVWDYNEFSIVLGELQPYCADYFGVTKDGNWEGNNILTRHPNVDQLAKKHELSAEQFMSLVDKGRQLLFSERSKRIRPATDHKIIAAWNALYLTALCKASMALKDTEYLQLAVQLHDQMIARFLVEEKMIYHVSTNNQSLHAACLDDLACFIQSLIVLQESTSDMSYLETARKLIDQALMDFGDDAALFFYYTSQTQTDLIYRKTDFNDGAIPSGNSLMAENLYYLSVVFDNTLWRERAMAMWSEIHKLATKYPASFGIWATSMLKQRLKVKELVLTGHEAKSILSDILAHYFPQKIIQTATEPLNYPLLQGKSFQDPITAYICEDYACQKTGSTSQDIIQALDELSTY